MASDAHDAPLTGCNGMPASLAAHVRNRLDQRLIVTYPVQAKQLMAVLRAPHEKELDVLSDLRKRGWIHAKGSPAKSMPFSLLSAARVVQ
eukprot:4751501-Pyramimonas_sp.AAC.1